MPFGSRGCSQPSGDAGLPVGMQVSFGRLFKVGWLFPSAQPVNACVQYFKSKLSSAFKTLKKRYTASGRGGAILSYFTANLFNQPVLRKNWGLFSATSTGTKLENRRCETCTPWEALSEDGFEKVRPAVVGLTKAASSLGRSCYLSLYSDAKHRALISS